MQATQAKTRLDLLDSIRGATLLSMAAYHTVWDLVYLFGVQWDWYKGVPPYPICRTEKQSV